MTTQPNPIQPAHWSDLDPYIKPPMLRGAVVPVTIDRIEFQELHPRPGATEIKPVCYFVGKQKGLILTSTNQDMLRNTYGDDITASYGKTVTLTAEQIKVAGKLIDTIRIRPT